MKHIRLWGIGVFFGTILAILLLWWLFAGVLLERAVEEVGTHLVGARVDLASADVGLFPISIDLRGLEITNPNEPMTNAVEIARIAAAVEAGPLFKRKVWIDQLLMQGVQLGTPRETSGAIGKPVDSSAEEAAGSDQDDAFSLAMPSFDVPNINEILASEDLESLRLIEDARKEADNATKDWKKRIAGLPDEARLNEYKDRVSGLGKGGIAGAFADAREIASLRKDLERDIKALESASKDIQTEAKRVQQLASRAARAPARDLARLQEKYGLSQQGVGNLSRRLLGPQIGETIATALEWWARIEPLVSRFGGSEAEDAEARAVTPLRGKGMIVRFPEDAATPDFLIRQTDVSVMLEAGTFSGTIFDITPDQPIHGKPLRFEFAGQQMQGLERIALKGTIDRRDPDDSKDTVVFALEKYRLEDITLSDTEPWEIGLTRGTLDLDLEAERVGEQIAVKAAIVVGSAALEPRFGGSGAVAKAIAKTLSEVDQFNLTADMRGTLDNYEIEIRSNMDNLLRRAVSRLAAQQTARLKAQLSKGIAERTAGPLAALQGDVSGLGGLQGEIAKRTDLAEDLLSGGKKKKRRLPGGFKLPF